MAQKPSIAKGTRDFNPEEVAKRNYIFNTIRQNFERFGFQPIETPSFENSETLMGKYGDEGDRLIFKILNSGEYLENFSTVFVAVTSSFIESYFLDQVNNAGESFEKEKFLISQQYVFKNFEANLNKMNGKNKVVIENVLDEQYVEIVFSVISEHIDSVLLNAEEYVKIKLDTGRCDTIFDAEKRLFMLMAGFVFSAWCHRNSLKLTSHISEKALRYDLTVPFARYVVQHQNDIEFPFKRYQIQPVWRADRPQKGRFREFFQCDADVVGSNSLWQEVEFVQLYDAVFTALKLEGVTIKINNRKILSGIAEVIGAQDKLIDFTVALDKLDKIGEEKVKEEMLSRGIPQSGIDIIQPLFSLSGSFESQIVQLKSILETSEEGKKGIAELEFIDKSISELKLQSAQLQLDVTLARGLNYYTGAIYEVAAPEGVAMGSIGGGGRYDDLTGIFGLKNVSGVGISFGLDRIYLVLEALNLFPETITNTVKALFINFGEAEALASMKAIQAIRKNGINAELYPDKRKTIKQFNYANKRSIPNVVLVGESELNTGTYTLRNMATGDQQSVDLETLIEMLQSV